MSELPEVEVVCAGLARHVAGCTVTRIKVLDPRPLRRRDGGAQAFVSQLTGHTLTAAVRRGKFLWLPLDDGRALSAHLGMSGQLLVHGTTVATAPGAALESHCATAFLADPDTLPGGRPADLSAIEQPRYVRDISISAHHLRVRLYLSTGLGGDNGTDGDDGAGAAVLDLAGQHMFGGLHVVDLTPTANGTPGGMGDPRPPLPADATHITRDLLDLTLELTGPTGVVARVRTSRRAIKIQLLDQGLISGIGNIYADEGPREAGVHGLRPGTGLGPRVVARILESTIEVTCRVLGVDGTSFDALYVDVKGAAGFFAHELGAYGCQGLECHRCKATMVCEALEGRSHTYCPRCQIRPRRHCQASPALADSLHDSITAELPGL